MEAAPPTPEDKGVGPSDAQLADVDGLIDEVAGFIREVEAWTIPATLAEQRGRRLHLDGSSTALNAFARHLSKRAWEAKVRVQEKHSQRFDSGCSAFQVGWGGVDFSLHHAVAETLNLLVTPTDRSAQEREVSISGVPKNAGFEEDDFISEETMERFRSVVRLLRRVRDRREPFDPYAILHPGLGGPRLEAMRMVIRQQTEAELARRRTAAGATDGSS